MMYKSFFGVLLKLNYHRNIKKKKNPTYNTCLTGIWWYIDYERRWVKWVTVRIHTVCITRSDMYISHIFQYVWHVYYPLTHAYCNNGTSIYYPLTHVCCNNDMCITHSHMYVYCNMCEDFLVKFNDNSLFSCLIEEKMANNLNITSYALCLGYFLMMRNNSFCDELKLLNNIVCITALPLFIFCNELKLLNTIVCISVLLVYMLWRVNAALEYHCLYFSFSIVSEGVSE